jgi:Ca-activated chloride channel family protein
MKRPEDSIQNGHDAGALLSALAAEPGDGHDHLRYLLTAYLFGQITAEGAREVEGHLAACAACREELEVLRRTRRLLEDALGSGGPGYAFDERRRERILAAGSKRRFAVFSVLGNSWVKAALWLFGGLLGLTIVVVSLVKQKASDYRGATPRYEVAQSSPAKPGEAGFAVPEAYSRVPAGAAAGPLAGEPARPTVDFDGVAAEPRSPDSVAAEPRSPDSVGAAPRDAEVLSFDGKARHADDFAPALNAPVADLSESAGAASATAGSPATPGTVPPTLPPPSTSAAGAVAAGKPAPAKEAPAPSEAASATKYFGAALSSRQASEELRSGVDGTESDKRGGRRTGVQGPNQLRQKIAVVGGGQTAEIETALEVPPGADLNNATNVEISEQHFGALFAGTQGRGGRPDGGYDLAMQQAGQTTPAENGRTVAGAGGGSAAGVQRGNEPGMLKQGSPIQGWSLSRELGDRDREALESKEGDETRSFKLEYRRPQAAGEKKADAGVQSEDSLRELAASVPDAAAAGVEPVTGRHRALVRPSEPSAAAQPEGEVALDGREKSREGRASEAKTLAEEASKNSVKEIEDVALRRDESVKAKMDLAGRLGNEGQAAGNQVLEALKKLQAPAQAGSAEDGEREETSAAPATPESLTGMLGLGDQSKALGAILETPLVLDSNQEVQGMVSAFEWNEGAREGQAQRGELSDAYRSYHYSRGVQDQARAALGAGEVLLRNFANYRAVDPSLTWDRYYKRPLLAPPPGIDDEGLGESEFRRRYGTNPFVDTQRDHFSTFALDVDTASFTLAKARLEAGRLPDPKAVRVEECINYFKQDYRADRFEAFSVFADGMPSPFGPPGVELVRLGIKARELAENERRAAVLTVAVDVSGSMAEARHLELVKRALARLVDALSPSDQLAVVTYSNQASLLLPHTLVRQRERILGAIAALSPAGGTNVEAGLDLAYRIADESLSPGSVHRVLLFSDGVANIGSRRPEELLERLRVFARRGIYLTVVGVGSRVHDRLLERLANEANGRYDYLESDADALRIFKENLPGALEVLAEDAKIQVDFNAEVVARYRLLGYENRDIRDEDFRNDKVDAGEVGPGTTVTALYEIVRHPAASGPLGKVFLRFRDTATRLVVERDYPVPPGILAPETRGADFSLRHLAAAAETAELWRQSYYARDGSFAKVLAFLESFPEAERERPEWQELHAAAYRSLQLTVETLRLEAAAAAARAEAAPAAQEAGR